MADAKIVIIGGAADDQDHDIPDNTDPAWRVHQGATDYITVDTSDGEESVDLVSSGTGTVGIGSGFTTPQELLHIAHPGTGVGDEALIRFTTGDTGHGADDGGHVGVDKDKTVVVWNKDAQSIYFGTNDTTRLVMTWDGKVGAGGITSPKSVLHLSKGAGSPANLAEVDTQTVLQIQANSGVPSGSANKESLHFCHNGDSMILQASDGETNSTVPKHISLNPFGGHTSIGKLAPTTLLDMAESEVITGTVTDRYASAITLDPGYTADSASTFTITNSNYINLQNPSAANAGSGDLNITNAPVFKLDAALGTHKATTSTDKSSGTASGTLKVDVNGTLYHIQLYAES